jgi:RNA polymerase sigma factor (sigma-70 family)
MNISTDDILRLKEGDHQVFKLIYEASSHKVFFYFLKKTGSEDVSKELGQQVFIKLWTYRQTVSVEYTIDQQLFQKAGLIFIDWLRAEARQRSRFCANADISEEAFQTSSNEIRQDIQESLNTLSPKRRKVFELKHIHGYSYKEIADFLGITVRTVDNHLLKATSQLRKVFNL